MSDQKLTARPEKPGPEIRAAQDTLRKQVFGNLIERLKPWLFEFGSWIFGGLIALNVVLVASELTVGPAHPAVVVSIAAFVCALPLDVLGLLLLRLIKDMSGVSIDTVMHEAFQDAAPSVAERLPAPQSQETETKLRTDYGLRYAVRLAGASIVLTLVGFEAALWYMAWWVAVIFLVMVVVSLMLSWTLVRRLMRPDVKDERELRQRYEAQRAQQSKLPRDGA